MQQTQETLDPVVFTKEIKNKIIGYLVKNDIYNDLKSADEATILVLHHSLGQWIRNKFLWKNYGVEDAFVHPDDISYEWIVSVREFLNTEDFDIQEWKKNHPEYLI